jgi:sulfite exporter TauE/SafE
LLSLARSTTLTVALRTLVGAVLVVAALRLLDRKGRLSSLSKPGHRIWQGLRPLQRPLLPADSFGKRIALGMLWAWMPCGLSTTLLAAAWLQASAWHGALTMAAFGFGTLPVMLPLTWSGLRLGRRLQRGGWRAAAAALLLASGGLTLSAPWLVRVPAFHGVLTALGCQSLPS